MQNLVLPLVSLIISPFSRIACTIKTLSERKEQCDIKLDDETRIAGFLVKNRAEIVVLGVVWAIN